MTAALLDLFAPAFFGGLAAAGFGYLFNFRRRDLLWCAAAGAFALYVRTLGLEGGWSLEGASFAAALSVSLAAGMLKQRLGSSGHEIALCGCIPMVPGAFMSKAILGLFALTAPHVSDADGAVLAAMQDILRVFFTLCAIGTGLVLPMHISKGRSL